MILAGSLLAATMLAGLVAGEWPTYPVAKAPVASRWFWVEVPKQVRAR